VGHCLHARTAHAHASADGVDALVVGLHRDLGALAGIAGRAHDLDQALADLRHLDLEQLLQAAAVRAAAEQLRTARLGAHVLEIGADALARTHRLARNHLLAGDEGLGVAAEIDEHVAALDTFDDAGDQFALAVTVLVDDLGALRLAHLLHDDL